ncbi:MAG: FAD-dependent oxidoreductase [Rhodococcus sp.]|nr:FAD-dependent oxidoreductase [Rhodococcus sp. (in: high G+C Gram-positive bacteria)]
MAAHENHQRVVVVGGGYAGVAATNRLLKDSPHLSVTVVNPREVFVERVRLHQLAAGNSTATVPLRDVLHPDARLEIASVDTIEHADRRVALGNDTTLDYDYLIYAAGSRSRPDVIDGADIHGWSVAEYEDAHRLREHIHGLAAGSVVTVIGGGLTGIETATEIADQRPELDVMMISSDSIASTLSDGARSKVLHVMDDLGITTISDAAVTEIAEGKIVLAGGQHLHTDCAIVTSSFVASDLAQRSGLATDADGRLSVDATLESESSPFIVGAGDAMTVDEAPLRMSCQAAVPLGTHAAETVLALIEGAHPKPLSPKFVGQCLSLGRRKAVFQRTNSSDDVREWSIGGRAGAVLKEQIVSSTVKFALNPKRGFTYSWS